MKQLLLSLVAIFGLASAACADDESIHFASVDIYLDSAAPFAAWQFELSDQHGVMKVVGVEQGDSDAFQRVPYYDREAVRLGDADRIIVADYSLADIDDLPRGRTRIATIHLMLSGTDGADFDLNLVTATTYAGEVTDARISLDLRTGSEQ